MLARRGPNRKATNAMAKWTEAFPRKWHRPSTLASDRRPVGLGEGLWRALASRWIHHRQCPTTLPSPSLRAAEGSCRTNSGRRSIACRRYWWGLGNVDALRGPDRAPSSASLLNSAHAKRLAADGSDAELAG